MILKTALLDGEWLSRRLGDLVVENDTRTSVDNNVLVQETTVHVWQRDIVDKV